jgi:hypothetical protein
VQAIVVHPRDPQLLWVGTRRRGVFVSSNGGRHFAQVTEGLEDLDVRSLALDAQGHLWAGTAHGGLFRSNDGVVWLRASLGATRVDQVIPDPERPRTLLVSADRRIWRSETDGAGWNTIFVPPAESDAVRALRSHDPQLCAEVPYRLVRHPQMPGSLWFLACSQVYVSRDRGAHWTSLGLAFGPEILDLAVDPQRPLRLVMALSAGLVESIDGGRTWSFLRQTAPGTGFLSLAVAADGSLIAGAGRGEVLIGDAEGRLRESSLRPGQTAATALDRALPAPGPGGPRRSISHPRPRRPDPRRGPGQPPAGVRCAVGRHARRCVRERRRRRHLAPGPDRPR